MESLAGCIELEAPGPSGLWNVRIPDTQTLLTEAHDVMSAVRAFWRELYDKRPVDLPGFQAVLGGTVPRLPEGARVQVQQYSMQDLQSVLNRADGKAPGPNHVEARFIKALPAPVQWFLVHSYRAILRGAPPPMYWRDAHIWLSPKVPGSARLDDYRPIALGQLDMKLLTSSLTTRITEVLTRHQVVSDWQQGALPGSNTGPPLFMVQRQLQRGRPNYVFSLDARKAFDSAPHGTLHLILRHLSVPPEVIHLLLFLHTCARLRIITAHGLTQPVNVLRGARQGNPKSPLLYALLLGPLLRAQGHRLRLPREANRGLIQAYIDDLLVVGHTLQHFVDGVEAVAAYLGMMGMELSPCKCAMATTEGVPGLQLRLCPHLENPWHWVPAADSVPYLGLPAVQTPPAPGGGAPLVPQHPRAAESGTGRHSGEPRGGDAIRRPLHRQGLRHCAPPGPHHGPGCERQGAIRLRRLAGEPAGSPDPRAYASADAVPAGSGRPRGHTLPAPLSLRARLGHQAVHGNRRCARHMPRGALLRPGNCNPGRGRLGPPHTPGLGRPGSGAIQPDRVPQGSTRPTTAPPGNIVTLRTGKLRHRDTCRLTVRHTTPWHGHHGPHHPFPENNDPWPAAVQKCLNQCADEQLH